LQVQQHQQWKSVLGFKEKDVFLQNTDKTAKTRDISFYYLKAAASFNARTVVVVST